MSIVSRQIDAHTIFPMRHPVKAVCPVAGDPQYAPFAQAPQKAHFNVSKNIAKPFILSAQIDTHVPGKVPLKSSQLGSHAGGMLFNAPQLLDIELLKTPVVVPTRLNMDNILTEYDPPAPIYMQNEGIRPSLRPLQPTPIAEPGPAIEFRTGGPTLYEQLRARPTPVALNFEDTIAAQVRGLYWERAEQLETTYPLASQKV